MPYPVNPLTGRAIRGFAAMSPERRKALATLGGASVAAPNRSFSKSQTLAARAGKKGGEASRRRRKNSEAPNAG